METTQTQTHAQPSPTEPAIVEISTKRETTRTHATHSPTHAPHSPTSAPHIPTEQHSTHPEPETTGPAESTEMTHLKNNTARPVETTQTLTHSFTSPTEQPQTSTQHSDISTKGPVTHFTHSPHKPTHEPHKPTTSFETTMPPVESTTGIHLEETSQSQINIEHTTKPESSTKSPGTHLIHPHETTHGPHRPTTKPFETSGFEYTTDNIISNPTKESTYPPSLSSTHGKDESCLLLTLSASRC